MSHARRRRDVEQLLAAWERTIGALARHLAQGDRDLEDDLAQVARVALWRSPRFHDGATTRRFLRHRMYDYRRARHARALVA